MAFNNFLQGVATKVVNTGLKKVAGNLPGLNLSYNPGSGINAAFGGNSADSLPLGPSANLTHYTFPLDVMADPGLGNQGHYVMFYINEQAHAKIKFGGKGGAASVPTGTSERGIPSSIKKITSLGNYTRATNSSGVKNQLNEDTPTYNDLRALGVDHGLAIAETKRALAASRDRQAVAIERAPTKRTKTAIAMYMPASVTTGYAAQYTDTEIGAVTREALRAYDQFAAGNMRGGLQEIGNMDTALSEALSAMMLNTAGALPGFAGLKAASEMRKGVVLSDRMELAFKGIDKRTFQYEFKMVPKSQDEANEIRSIIFAFKSNMLPEFVGGNRGGRRFLVPNTFDIQYMYLQNSNHFLHHISTCVLENMNVAYGGDRYKTFEANADGAPPMETTITLNFKEMELITRERVFEGY